MIVEKNYLNKILALVFVFATVAAMFSCSSDENVFVVPVEPPENNETEVTYKIHFIDVGQGDAIFIETPVKNLLVDAGWRDSGATEYLLDLDIERIDVVIGTHPHADHIGGLIEVFQTFEIGEVIDPGVTHTTQTFNTYLSTIDLYNIPFTVGRKGMEWQLSDEANMVLLHPVNPSSDHLNNASIVARVDLGDISVLLTGDAEKEAEQEMLNDPGLLSSHILKVGHHGSWTSSTEGFLNAVKPEVSVIMCGADNPYGHPHNVVMQRLNAVDTEIYRTDIHGHIIIETDGVEYTITTKPNQTS